MSKRKIIIIITASSLAVLVLAVALYLLISKGKETLPEASEGVFPSSTGTGSMFAEHNGGSVGFVGLTDNLQRLLIQLSERPVAGAAFASSTAVRYIEKSNGNIYEISPKGEERERISNTTVLKVFESFWSPSADKVMMRYLEGEEIPFRVKNFSAVINKAKGAVEGVFFSDKITAVAPSPYDDKIFYLVKSEGGAYGVVSDFEGERQKTVFSFPFGEFNARWVSPSKIALTTKPSAKAEGYLYLLDIRSGGMEKILGKKLGLTALVSPDAKKVLFSESSSKGIKTKILDVASGEVRSFGLNTLPEKCVWKGAGSAIIYCAVPKTIPRRYYPDEWYMGKVSFEDGIWRIDISTGEAKNILSEGDFDVVNPILSPKGNYLVFINKKDNTLWSLKVSE